MDQTAARISAPRFVVFSDGLGSRRRLDPGGESIEALCFGHALADTPLFESSVGERLNRLAVFTHPAFARVRAVERLHDRDHTLALMSTAVPGTRLSDLLATAAHRHVVLDLPAALGLVSQLAPAVAALHQQGGPIAHGCLGLERLIVRPDGGLVIAEHVLGSALQQCGYSCERYWSEFRVSSSQSAGLPVLDQRTDVMQVGIIALELFLGRPLRNDEYPAGIAEALASAWVRMPNGDTVPVPAMLRAWLRRALQLDLKSAFTNGAAMRDDLDSVLRSSGYAPSPAALKAFLDRCQDSDASESPRSAVSQPTAVSPTTPTIAVVTAVDRAEPNAEDALAPSEVLQGAVSSTRSGWVRRAVAATLLIGGTGIGATAALRYTAAAAPAMPRTGTLTVTTNPPGVQALVDGQPRGATPATLTLNPGAHVLELRGGGDARTFPITIAAGAQLSQYIEMSAGGPVTGSLEVRSDPPGAPVTVDDVPRGTTPVTVASLSTGEHSVALGGNGQQTKQTVRIDPGATASLVVHLPAQATGPASGWLSVSAPGKVQLFEGERLLGSSDVDRIMVAAGSHQLDIVNEELGYHGTQAVQVTAGKVSSVKIAFPKGSIALNAVPWAEVWIDGEKSGETPIGNLPIAIGTHDIVFRHPDLGEQHRTATVTLTSPARISVNMRAQ